MSKHSSYAPRIVERPVAQWVRVLSDRWHFIAGSFPSLSDAFSPDDLPLSFILERDSREADEAAGLRHHVSSDPAVRSVNRIPTVRLAEHRADARSTLRANAGSRRDLGRLKPAPTTVTMRTPAR